MSAAPTSAAPAARLYAILRSDITMSSGKAAAQAGHAFVDTLLTGLEQADPAAQAYAALRPGTKITLWAPLWAFDAIEALAAAYAIPCARIVDSGHVEPPHFDGSPVPTALGLGPFDQTRPIPKDLARAMKRARMWTGAQTCKEQTP